MPIWLKALAATAIIATAGPSHAARDFTPQAGTWIVSSELDGKPGRGLAIDVQGNTFFMQVFGYEKNGEATFYTATGQMDGNGVTAPLMRYQGGRSFGSGARDAVEDKTVGNVAVRFSNGLKGTVQFPGEPALAIERFLVRSAEPDVSNPLAQLGTRDLQVLALNAADLPVRDWRLTLSQYDGSLRVRLDEGVGFRRFGCGVDWGHGQLDCQLLPAEQTSSNESIDTPVQSLHLQIAGYDVTGVAQLAGVAGERWHLMGRNQGAFYTRFQEGSRVIETQQNYDALYRSYDCSTVCIRYQYENALMPINGTWLVEDEWTGKPGRGLALDVQGNTVVLQVFNYRANGQPVFHMGTALYASKGPDSGATMASVPLVEYAGGRSLGGVPQSAQAREQAGVARLEFSLAGGWGAEGWPWWTRGQLQLPGEAAVRIRRMVVDTPANPAERLLGQWYLPQAQKTIQLTSVSGDTATSADGLLACTLQAVDADFKVNCKQALGAESEQYLGLILPAADRANAYMVRLRDRHGNAVGLGKLD